MSSGLYKLVYCSRSCIGDDHDISEREIRDILAVARKRNKIEGVTGALLFTATGFAQTLEGPRDAVQRTFERISCDRRHRDVIVLSFLPAERRSFSEWSMGFSGQAEAGNDPLARLMTDAALNCPPDHTGEDVLRLLEAVVQREDEWITV